MPGLSLPAPRPSRPWDQGPTERAGQQAVRGRNRALKSARKALAATRTSDPRRRQPIAFITSQVWKLTKETETAISRSRYAAVRKGAHGAPGRNQMAPQAFETIKSASRNGSDLRRPRGIGDVRFRSATIERMVARSARERNVAVAWGLRSCTSWRRTR